MPNISPLIIRTIFIFLTGGVIGYGISQHNVLSAVFEKEQASVKKLTEIETKFETLLNKTQIATTINQKQQNFLFTDLKRTLQRNYQPLLAKDNSTNSLPVKNLSVDSAKNNQCNELMKQIDVASFNTLATDTQSSDFNARRRALVVLALLGSAQAKQGVDAIIKNENEDQSLRLDLMKASDWQGKGIELAELVGATSSVDIKIASIQEAQDIALSSDEKKMMEAEVSREFLNNPDDGVKISALNYFANTASDKLFELVESIPKTDISPEVKNQIDFIMTPSSSGKGG
jgi:hypothetical protein